MAASVSDVIPVDSAKHLPGLFRERVRRSPQAIAYRHYVESEEAWRDLSYQH